MKRLVSLGVILVALACFTPTAFSQGLWFENWDGYQVGSQAVGQGGWEEWSAGAGAFVTAAQSRSTQNSIDIAGPTDLVHQYFGYTAGKWQYTAWQYVPSGITAKSYFIIVNTYAYPSGPYSWSVQMGANPATNLMEADVGGTTQSLPLVYDQWVEIKVVIHLDVDWTQIFYNGALFDDPALADHPQLGGGYSWTGEVFGTGGGQLNIGAVDLYANSATSVYYDDLSLVPYIPLESDVGSISMGTGGAANFKIRATTEFAGKLYALLTSFSGTTPGTPLPSGLVLPLNFDGLTDMALQMPNIGIPFNGYVGILDAAGEASASLTLPPYPALAGWPISQAWVVIDSVPVFNAVSNGLTINLVP